MLKLLLTVFLALSLVNQLQPIQSGTETAQVSACVPGQANLVFCFSSEFDDDQRLVGMLPVALLALPFGRVSVFPGGCQDDRQKESLGGRLPLHMLNVVFLI